MTVPITVVEVPSAAEALVLEVLRSGRLAQGPMVERFERAGAAMAGTNHAVATSSGTTALVASLEVLDLEPGDEVLTSPFTFIATLNAILEAGATATFADIGDDFNIDVASMQDAVTPATRVVMPVHLYGQPADMPAITAFATDRDLAVVEDAAQAHGASIDGRPAGSFGRLACFSFYATKNVTTGEGGLVTTDDAALADRLQVLRNQGMRERYQYEVAGHNYRMTELQAAVGIAEFDVLATRNAARRRNAQVLCDGLRDVPGLTLPSVGAGREHAWHQFTVRVGAETGIDRSELARRLAERGVESGVYYPRLVFDDDCYRAHPRMHASEVPRARAAASEVLSLPVHWALSAHDLEQVVDGVRAALRA